MRFKIIFFFCLSVVHVFAHQELEETPSFELPADWSSIRSSIDTSFSCIGRAYGYYADVANQCQLYHICEPRNENGLIVYTHNPFICPRGTVFDQQALTCVHATPQFSCSDSMKYYDTKSQRNLMIDDHGDFHFAPVDRIAVVTPPERNAEVEPAVENLIDARVNRPAASQPFADDSVSVSNSVQPSLEVENRVPIAQPETVNRAVVFPTVASNDESAEVDAPLVSNVVSEYEVPSSARGVEPSKPINVVKSMNVQKSKIELPVKSVVAQEPVAQKMELPVKSVVAQEPVAQKMELPVKSVVAQAPVAQKIELPVKSVVAQAPVAQKIELPVKSVVAQEPVAQKMELPVKSVVAQAPVAQKIELPVKSVVAQAPVAQKIELPVKSVVAQAPVAQKIELPVKSVVAQAPVAQKIELPVKSVVAQEPVAQKIELPVKSVIAQEPVAQKIELPVKSVVAQEPVAQKIELPVKSVVAQAPVAQKIEMPAKSPVFQQVAMRLIRAPAKVNQQQLAMNQVKAIRSSVIRQQVKQVEKKMQPRKSFGPIKQQVLGRVYNVPSWRHHYVALYPHLIYNNPYHAVRHAPRWV